MKTCQFIGVSDSFLRETILIQWQYYTAASSHFPDRANQATKTARNVTKNATGYDVDIFSHIPPLQPVLSTFHPPSFLLLSTSHSLSSNIPSHTHSFILLSPFYPVALDMSPLSSYSIFLVLFLTVIWGISN